MLFRTRLPRDRVNGWNHDSAATVHRKSSAQFCGRNDCTDRVFNQEEANSLVIEGDRFKRLVLNRNERHDLSVNRPCTGEILELDEKSVSNLLALCDY